MPTINQILNNARTKKIRHKKRLLDGRPHMSGKIITLVKRTPKKPNSAQRSVVKLLLSSGLVTYAYVPGEGNSLKPHDNVLVKVNRRNDLIGMRLEVVRGAKDCEGVKNRCTARSKYGTKRHV